MKVLVITRQLLNGMLNHVHVVIKVPEEHDAIGDDLTGFINYEVGQAKDQLVRSMPEFKNATFQGTIHTVEG